MLRVSFYHQQPFADLLVFGSVNPKNEEQFQSQ